MLIGAPRQVILFHDGRKLNVDDSVSSFNLAHGWQTLVHWLEVGWFSLTSLFISLWLVYFSPMGLK